MSEMYKKAARLKLRFDSKFGQLNVETLFDLKMSELKVIIKNLAEAKKAFVKCGDEDLSFLDNVAVSSKEQKEKELADLRFEIAKDIYTTRSKEIENSAKSEQKKLEIKKLEEIIARKKDTELENMSVEDLEKKIEELSK